MALDSQYDGTISALPDRMKLELQAVMTQVIDARRNIDYECENAHKNTWIFMPWWEFKMKP